MVFVSYLIEVNDEFVIVEFYIIVDLMFCELEGLFIWSSIEFMVQIISVYVGYKGQIKGLLLKIGFLLGICKMQLFCVYYSLGIMVQIWVE